MQQDPRFLEGQRFREKVIRQAILLGFTAEQYESAHSRAKGKPDGGEIWTVVTVTRWRFTLEGKTYNAYASLYTAAMEYLRLLKVPSHLIGVRDAEDT